MISGGEAEEGLLFRNNTLCRLGYAPSSASGRREVGRRRTERKMEQATVIHLGAWLG